MRYLLLLFLSFVNVLSIAQNINKRFVINNRPVISSAVAAINDTIYVMGTYSVSSQFNTLEGYIVKSNKAGNFIDSSFVRLNGKNHFAFHNIGFTATFKDKIAITGYTYDNSVKALLYITNTQLDSVLLKEYSFPNSNRSFGHKIARYANGDFLIAGRLQFINSFRIDVLLIRTDSFGNEIWKKSYGDSILWEAGYDINILANGNARIAVCSEDDNRGSEAIYATAYYLEIDGLGNKVWDWRDPDTSTVLLAMTPTQDGGFVGAGSYISYRSKPYGFRKKGYWVKFNSQKQKIAEQVYGVQSGQSAFNDVIALPDGGYMVCGALGVDTFIEKYNRNADICRLDSDGNIIWRRSYRGFSSSSDCCSSNMLYDMELLPDGSIVATGQADDETGTPQFPSQQGWLLHIDSNGCLLPSSCGITDVEEVFLTTENLEVALYPNPAYNQVTVTLSNYNYQPIEMRVYDVSGKTVLQQNIEAEQTIIDVTIIPRGIYTLQVVNGNLSTVKRFVKE